MKQLLDYIPLIVFFTVWTLDERVINIAGFDYTLGGIFSAAEFLVVTSILVYGGIFLVQKRLDKMQVVTLVVVILACLPTIYFRNTDYLKWKAPVVNWIFAAVFLGSRFVSDKSAIEHMMGHTVDAPKHVWHTLNTVWILFFIVLGAVNLAVAFTLSESMWINFKVRGNLIITFIFVFAQMPYLAKYITEEEQEEEQSSSTTSPP
ncbi:MAG: septation protein IspZ [Gammaproteobacteria bacterium]|nr:septation protein IspZ [Gammaproteobacteria bacterium]